MHLTVKVGRRGVVVLLKAVREELNIVEDSLLELEVKGREITLRPLDLWERVWGW